MPATKEELERFHRFVTKRLHNGVASMSLEESLAEFRAYEQEAARFRAELQASIDEAQRGETGPLDVERLKAEVREELARDGITE